MERGNKNLEEAKIHKEKGDYEAAEEKRKQAEEDITIVAKASVDKMNDQLRGLQIDVANLENFVNGITTRGRQILREEGYNIKS